MNVYVLKHLLVFLSFTLYVCVCVCLTIFISIFSSSTDSAPQHLDMFTAGSAVELVDPVVSPTHGVSHLCLVLYMHAEVHPIHTKYLLGIYRHVDTRESLTGFGKTKHPTRPLYRVPALDHACRLSPVMDCTSPVTSGYIWGGKWETDEFQCVYKLICNLCKEHWMLENSRVTASFPSLSSLLFFLLSISFRYWAITHTAGCVAASATWHTDVLESANRQHPERCLLLRYQTSVQTPISDPFMTLTTLKSGLQMTSLAEW